MQQTKRERRSMVGGEGALRRGTTIVDVVVCTAMVVLLLVLVLTALPRIRRSGMLVQCINNQRFMLSASASWALAYQDHFMGFSWQKGNQSSQYADLRAQANQSDTGAQAAQAVDLLRRHGRTDIPSISSWVASALTTGLVLFDYLDRPLTEEFNVCPADTYRLQWRRNPTGFNQGLFLPFQPSPGGVNGRWPYTSSYLLTVSAWDRGQTLFAASNVTNRLSHQGTHSTWTTPFQATLGTSRYDRVLYPAEKIFFFDSNDWHVSATARYHAFPGAVPVVAFFDGAVRPFNADAANPGWFPTAPATTFQSQYTYSPQPWETPIPAGMSANLIDPFRFTRNGLFGWDDAPRDRLVPEY